jgi:hypothetical protein
MGYNQSSSYNNYLLHEMLKAGVFDTLSHEQSRTVLRALSNVENAEIGDIFEGLPESLNYCISCEEFVDKVKFIVSWGLTMCKSCCDCRYVNWNNPNGYEDDEDYDDNNEDDEGDDNWW